MFYFRSRSIVSNSTSDVHFGAEEACCRFSAGTRQALSNLTSWSSVLGHTGRDVQCAKLVAPNHLEQRAGAHGKGHLDDWWTPIESLCVPSLVR